MNAQVALTDVEHALSRLERLKGNLIFVMDNPHEIAPDLNDAINALRRAANELRYG